MKLSKATEGFILAKVVEGDSPRTTTGYTQELALVVEYLDDPPIDEITTGELRQFFDYLGYDFKPARWNRDTSPLSPRTLRYCRIALRSFFTWALVEFDMPDPLAHIPAPKAIDARSVHGG